MRLLRDCFVRLGWEGWVKGRVGLEEGGVGSVG